MSGQVDWAVMSMLVRGPGKKCRGKNLPEFCVAARKSAAQKFLSRYKYKKKKINNAGKYIPTFPGKVKLFICLIKVLKIFKMQRKKNNAFFRNLSLITSIFSSLHQTIIKAIWPEYLFSWLVIKFKPYNGNKHYKVVQPALFKKLY